MLKQAADATLIAAPDSLPAPAAIRPLWQRVARVLAALAVAGFLLAGVPAALFLLATFVGAVGF